MRLSFMLLLTILLAGGLCARVSGEPQEEKSAQKSPVQIKKEKPAAKTSAIDSAREAELLMFVREHHAELADLLTQLKPQDVAKYQAALADLDRDFKRLDQLRKRSSVNYENELNLWKSRSRVRLLAARLSMTGDAALREELKAALRDLRQQELAAVDREMSALKSSLEKQQQKLEKLGRQQAKLQADGDQWIEQQLTALEQAQRSKADKPVKSGKAKQTPAAAEKSAPIDTLKRVRGADAP